MIVSFASGATASLVAKNVTKYILLLWIKSSPVDRFWCLRFLQGSNLEFWLLTRKPITGIFFDNNLIKLGLAVLHMVDKFDFLMFIFLLFEELKL